MMIEFLREMWGFCLFVGALMAFCIWGLILNGKEEARKEAQFMAECRRERRQYECTVLWRAGNSKTDVIYVPMATH